MIHLTFFLSSLIHQDHKNSYYGVYYPLKTIANILSNFRFITECEIRFYTKQVMAGIYNIHSKLGIFKTDSVTFHIKV